MAARDIRHPPHPDFDYAFYLSLGAADGNMLRDVRSTEHLVFPRAL